MGQLKVETTSDSRQVRLFEKNLLNDVSALEQMLESGMIESGICRIGAEQELFLVDESTYPLPVSLKVLDEIEDTRFTTELASFNLEFNLDPVRFEDDCLAALELQLLSNFQKVKLAGEKHGARPLMTGVLPTLRKSDLHLGNMTPRPRYHALNEAMNRLRGREYDLYLRGIDELYIKHDSVMLEACNTSFQVHFQVSAEEFARYYNIAQAVAGPVLAAAVNSPMLFGRRLWNETRIAVFQQSTDTRHSPRYVRHAPARVHFGHQWIQKSVLEIFKEDIARFRVLFAIEVNEDAVRTLAQGQPPKLQALQLHNSTIYRWTRPCYGITEGKPHLRIENRIFPSGPTVVDEVANAAFWLGVITGIGKLFDDVTEVLDFDDVKGNFYAAARRGLKAQFTWTNNKTVPAHKLIRKELLPIAESGLRSVGLREEDIKKYLGVIDRRVAKGQTGAEWTLRSFSLMKNTVSLDETLSAITKAQIKHQDEGKPVHDWPLAKSSGKSNVTKLCCKVEQIMTTDLFTINQEDTVDLVLSVMSWRHIRHLPVEDHKNRLVGIVTYRSLVSLIQQQRKAKSEDLSLLPVSKIMQKNVATVSPSTHTLEAIALMREKGVSCLPVVSEDRLVGIVTEYDFMKLAAQFIETLG